MVVLKENKLELEIEVKGEDHTFCNALKEMLNKNTNVVKATYKVEHPLVSSPVIFIQISPKYKLKDTSKETIDLSEIKGVGPKRKEQLEAAGIKSANDLLDADPDKLAEASGIPKSTIDSYMDLAKELDYGGTSAPREVLKQSLEALKKEFITSRDNFLKASS